MKANSIKIHNRHKSGLSKLDNFYLFVEQFDPSGQNKTSAIFCDNNTDCFVAEVHIVILCPRWPKPRPVNNDINIPSTFTIHMHVRKIQRRIITGHMAKL